MFPVSEDYAEAVSIRECAFHMVLFGGDQLTVARARGSQMDRVCSDNNVEKLCSLIPVLEDWHTKIVILLVCKITLHALDKLY